MSFYKNILNEVFSEIDENYGEFPMPSYEDLDSEELNGSNGLKFRWLYRVFFKRTLSSISKFGYDREFTGLQAGNSYGAGVYTTWSLPDSIKNFKENKNYGDAIMKMKVIGGFTKFIILDKNLAIEIYGSKWRFEDQIKLLFPKSDVHKIIYRCYNYGECGSNINHAMNDGRTSGVARIITKSFESDIIDNGVRGIIYKGNGDGHVALPFDFSSVIPHSYSVDCGKTWKKIFDNDLYDRLNNSIDAKFRYGNKYKKIFKPTIGFARVINNEGKINFIDIQTDKEITTTWFDVATEFDTNTRIAKVSYNDWQFNITNEYAIDDDGFILCDLDDIPQYYNVYILPIQEREKNKSRTNENIEINYFKDIL